MELDENLLGQVSSFLNSEEGRDILSNLKETLGIDDNGSNGSNGDISSIFSSLNGNKTSPFENIDIAKLIPLVTAISSAKTDDRATNLLLALKPLLSRERHGKIDHAISILKILALLPILKEYGFSITDLFSN